MGLRYTDIVHKPDTVLDVTSLTPDEFAVVLPVFERAFQAHMAEFCLDGTRRRKRRYTTYANCPLPTPADRLLYILMYLKTNPLQVAHGLMFDLPQGKANMWIHCLLPQLQAALRQLGDAPARSMDALQSRCDQLLGDDETAPLFVMMEPNGASNAPQTRLNKPATRAGRSKRIR